MIVVGILGASGTSVLEIARRAAATGARTEVVGAAPLGPGGDRLLLQLAAAGVGHATVTRFVAASPVASSAASPAASRPAPPSSALVIEPADLELALRYLPDVRAIVLGGASSALLATASAAANFAGATLVVIGPVGVVSIDAGSALGDPIVLDPPARDPDGAFAGLVAALAVRLDAGADSGVAWQSTLAALAIDPA